MPASPGLKLVLSDKYLTSIRQAMVKGTKMPFEGPEER